MAPQLELYFPYTGTDSLSVSTCQLPQANTSPLGCSTSSGASIPREDDSGTDALHPPKPSHSTRNRTKDLHGSELHVSSSSSPDFWQRRALDVDVVLFSPSGRAFRYCLWRSWRVIDAMASCRREIEAVGREAVWKMDMSTRAGWGVASRDLLTVLEGVAGVSVGSISMFGLGCWYLEVADTQTMLGQALAPRNTTN